MNKEGKIIEGFAENSDIQRRRCVRAENEELLKLKIKQLEDRWLNEYRYYRYQKYRIYGNKRDTYSENKTLKCTICGKDVLAFEYANHVNSCLSGQETQLSSSRKEPKKAQKDNFSQWQRMALKKILNFPDPPTSPKSKKYKSAFPLPPFQLINTAADKVHLDDYRFFRNTKSPQLFHRLPGRTNKIQNYPVPMPMVQSFPSGIKKLLPVEIPPEPDLKSPQHKWFHYLLFWQLWELVEKSKKGNEAKKTLYEFKRNEAEDFNMWLERLQEDRQLYWKNKKKHFDKVYRDDLNRWEEAKKQWENGVSRDKLKLRELYSRYEMGSGKAVVDFFLTHLDRVPLPKWCPREYELEFDNEEGILLIEAKLPNFDSLEIVKTRELKWESKVVPANQKEIREITNQFPYLIVLRLIWEVPQVDYSNRVNMVCCNGYVIYDDPATGRKRRDVILSVAAKREDLKTIKVDRIEPEACFRGLNGVAAAKISELVPIQPIIRFNKEDRRFIAAKDILDTVGDKNLATMDWQDFEHLIRELFEKVYGSGGAEVKITQASRDRGVDAIVYDPDPLKGGKYVIQAKRYTHTVDVSSVRDLYGTVLNEGASRGILVTTSNYGRDAHDFIKNKPITLLNGAELIHLLREHGYNAKIDLKEAKRLLRTQ